jgi:glycosyltransferase involved in cell wall biosynthesis
MKILVIHNFYQSSSPSGENSVFRNEVRLLETNGNYVIPYRKSNDDIQGIGKKLRTGLNAVWSYGSYRDLKRLIRREKPDIAHFHNIWYLISPSGYYACRDAGIPIVQTLHNFRLFCLNGLLIRNGTVCEKCLARLPWKGVLYGCYKNSRVYSLPIALTEGVHDLLGTWKHRIDAYIALTEFAKDKAVQGGLPERKVFVKPHFLSENIEPSFNDRGYGIFLGRLSYEKGVPTLIDAAKTHIGLRRWPLRIKIVGDGMLLKQMEDEVRTRKITNIELVGRRSFSECMELLRGAKFLIMPSISYECFPMTIREAFACGKPVIASKLGAMAELVDDGKTGLLFEPGNPEDLASKIKWMLDHRSGCIEMGKNARRVFEEKYTAEKNYEMLMGIYHSVLKVH